MHFSVVFSYFTEISGFVHLLTCLLNVQFIMYGTRLYNIVTYCEKKTE